MSVLLGDGALLDVFALRPGVHDALFERLGTRLFDATSEDQLQSLVVAEIGALMDARESALSPQERQVLGTWLVPLLGPSSLG